MPQRQSKSFDDAWTDLIQKTLRQGSNGRPAGEGWKSVKEFAEMCTPQLSNSQARIVLAGLLSKGVMERERGKDGAHWSYYYRPVKTSAK